MQNLYYPLILENLFKKVGSHIVDGSRAGPLTTTRRWMN